MDCRSICTIIFWLHAREDLQVLILKFVLNNKGLFSFIIKQLQNNMFDYIKVSSRFPFVSHWTQNGGSLFPFLASSVLACYQYWTTYNHNRWCYQIYHLRTKFIIYCMWYFDYVLVSLTALCENLKYNWNGSRRCGFNFNLEGGRGKRYWWVIVSRESFWRTNRWDDCSFPVF